MSGLEESEMVRRRKNHDVKTSESCSHNTVLEDLISILWHLMPLQSSYHPNLSHPYRHTTGVLQQTLHHFRYHARARTLPIGSPVYTSLYISASIARFSSSRSPQTFAFACLARTTNWTTSKRITMRTLKLRNSNSVGIRHRNSGSRCPCTDNVDKMH
jgi:hypothetical protein